MDNSLLSILVCPVCKGKLTYDTANGTLDCPACRLRYPVRDGIPVMLPDAARPYPAANTRSVSGEPE
ncbi:MAG TPA: Trm112 family protein [bacterium]|nr:Trm112 family protein [bacterium]